MAKKWMGAKPTTCNICNIPLDTFKGKDRFFVDGRTAFGPWALMCPVCHRDNGGKLGTGSGQKYSLDTLEKIDG